ncbi:MAG TPA: TetR/AcrR family transcriptional regulator [Kofleriaceae bacterium]|nr:TetR/AcrR family transcriptional regulator [Kofleriaceae bacterium]
MARPRTDIAPRILHAARARFLADGVDGASLRAIARGAGTSIGMLYYYFPTKDDLFLAVVEEVYSALLVDLTGALAPDAPVEERLGRLFARLGAVSDEELTVLRLVVREALVSSPRLERLFERFQRGHLPLLFSALFDGVAEGRIDRRLPLPVLLIATVAMGGLPQLIRRRAGHLPPFAALSPPEDLARMLVETLFHGIAPRSD